MHASRGSRPARLAGLIGATSLLAIGLAAGAVEAEEVVNIYSARHYDSDIALFREFTEQTGIKVNLVEGRGQELITRILAEGDNSPVDLFITVDAGRLWQAEQQGLFQPVESEVLESRIPEGLRHPEGLWFGVSTRARVIYHNPEIVPEPPTTYEALADPQYEGLLCMRSSEAVYNLSLLASLIEHHGEEEAEAWARGVRENFAREPEGVDSDQIMGVASGECGIAVANHYYFLRMMRSDDADQVAATEKVRLVWPNQEDRGVHANVSGGGVVRGAPNREHAIAFLEYLTEPQAQLYFTERNNEYPVVEGVFDNPLLESFGIPKRDAINVSAYGYNQPLAQMIYDRVGWR